MNRSILIVICDFLLVSLLAFSSVDINKTTSEGVPRQVKTTIATNQPDSRQDLAAVMRLALEEERKGRDTLLVELKQAREAAAQQQAVLREREQQVETFRQELGQKDQQVQTFRQELQQKDQQTAQLAQQQTNLQQQFAAAQTNIHTLTHELRTTSTEALISKERLAALQAELRKQAEQAAALQQQLGQLAQSNQLVLTEKQRLAGQLQVAEAEKRLVTEQVTRMQEEVKVERAEKAKLAEGVKALATRSDQLAQEIQQNRPLAPNTIFNEFITNRVQATLSAVRAGFFGAESSKRAETQTVLVTDGTNTVALCHVQDTPLSFGYPGTEWGGLAGTLGRGTVLIPIRMLSFYQLDPRVVFIPVTQEEVRQLGGKVYGISSEPYKFQDAVVVGAREGYYGECTFQIDLTTPLYVKMDRSSLRGLFGKFNPSRGDLVFSRTGELIGVMANSTYCMLIKNFNATATFQFAQDVRSQQTGETLGRLYSLIAKLPYKLQ
jgi:signal transduction histidine kinase